MRSWAKMSLPGQWMDLQMRPIIRISNHELSSSCTWSWRDSCRKPRQQSARQRACKNPGDPRPVQPPQTSSTNKLNSKNWKLHNVWADHNNQHRQMSVVSGTVGVDYNMVWNINTHRRLMFPPHLHPTHKKTKTRRLVVWQSSAS